MFKCLQNIPQTDKETVPKGHKFAEIFDKNTVKVSYSCMRTIKSIITAHNINKAILNPKSNVNHGCNCRVKENCPLDNKCLTPGIVCETTVKTDSNDEEVRYIDLTDGTFKQRYAKQSRNFKYSKI